jgi:SAM-dependent methyltransferase
MARLLGPCPIPECSVTALHTHDIPVPAKSEHANTQPSSTGVDSATAGTGLTEQQKYEAMWAHHQYRAVAPGEHLVHKFFELARPRPGATVIDFGCGTGRGAFMMALLGPKDIKVEMVDFAANCLDPDVVEIMKGQPHALSFTQADLTQPIPLTAEYGYCTDVMEHIPPVDVDCVLMNVLKAAQHVFFQISCVDDVCGALIGEPLHLSVHPPEWWLKKFNDLGCQVHYFHDVTDPTLDRPAACLAYVTAWMTGKEIVDGPMPLNVEDVDIRRNVRHNIAAGWQQLRPFEPNDKEVMIVGGGPSLESQVGVIRQMRAEGHLLVTLNGAYNWALDQGLSVSGTIVVDARPFNARFTHPVQDDTRYFVGSQCDPATFEGLPHERTWMWHTTAESIRDILEELCPGKWYGVVGGCTVLLRAIPLLRMLGYQRFHLFGCDSCVSAEAHHAYPQPENDGAPIFPTLVGGRKFGCTAWQIAQAQEFMNLIRVMGDMFELEVHGDGLLKWILDHGAELDVEREETTEFEKAQLRRL